MSCGDTGNTNWADTGNNMPTGTLTFATNSTSASLTLQYC